MIQKSVTVGLADGLDASVIASMVQLACKHTCTVHLKTEGKTVNAKSIMGMMNMAVAKGGVMTIICDGEDEETALKNIESFVQSSI